MGFWWGLIRSNRKVRCKSIFIIKNSNIKFLKLAGILPHAPDYRHRWECNMMWSDVMCMQATGHTHTHNIVHIDCQTSYQKSGWQKEMKWWRLHQRSICIYVTFWYEQKWDRSDWKIKIEPWYFDTVVLNRNVVVIGKNTLLASMNEIKKKAHTHTSAERNKMLEIAFRKQCKTRRWLNSTQLSRCNAMKRT